MWMARFINKYYNKTIGLTLIEVLIALSIVSIAMTAIIYAASQQIRTMQYLQNKSIANWVGQQVFNEVRAGIFNFPSDERQKTVVLDQEWYWQINKEDTANYRIKKITVAVYANQSPNAQALANLEGYIYVP